MQLESSTGDFPVRYGGFLMWSLYYASKLAYGENQPWTIYLGSLNPGLSPCAGPQISLHEAPDPSPVPVSAKHAGLYAQVTNIVS